MTVRSGQTNKQNLLNKIICCRFENKFIFYLKLVHRRQFLVLCSTILQTYGALWDNSRKIWKMQSAQSIKQKHSSETRMKEDRRWPLSNKFFSKIEWVHQRIALVWKIAVIHLSLNIKFPRLFSQFWFTFIFYTI